MRSMGYKVSIIDANAENLSNEEIYSRIKFLKPRLISFVVYGQNVNAGTTNMSGALRVSNYLKAKDNNIFISCSSFNSWSDR